MKVILKTVSGGAPFTVEIGDDATIGELLNKCGEENNYDCRAIAFKGKNLKDRAAKLQDVGVVDNEVCVIVGKKRKEAAKNDAPAPATSSAPAPAPESQAEKMEEDAPAPAASAPAASGDTSSTAATAEGAFLSGDKVEETIGMILAMGDWPRERVIQALQAAYNNPDRAVEFLFSGNIPQIPEAAGGGGGGGGAPAGGAGAGGSAAPATPAPAPASGATAAAPAANASVEIPGLGTLTAQQFAEIMQILSRTNANVQPAAVRQFLQRFGAEAPSPAGGASLSPLAARLSQIPEWDTIRHAIQSDPETMGRVMQAMRTNEPALFELIQANQQEFLQLVANGIPGAGGGAGTPGPGGEVTVTITPQDREAIQRLAALGFSEEEALQAYIVAERNEEVAANLLFDSGAPMGE